MHPMTKKKIEISPSIKIGTSSDNPRLLLMDYKSPPSGVRCIWHWVTIVVLFMLQSATMKINRAFGHLSYIRPCISVYNTGSMVWRRPKAT
jgi:hypothetical protein